MAKFHINKRGVPAICKAEAGNCPLGGDETHFENITEAQAHVDKINEEKYGILNNIDPHSNSTYEIPEGVKSEDKISKDDFLNKNHKLKKADGIWVHLDEDDKVVGTMNEPVVVLQNGELLEVSDTSNSNNNSIKQIEALKLLSKFNMLSRNSKSLVDSVDLHAPKENLNEYKDYLKNKKSEVQVQSLEAFKIIHDVKGPHKTSDLFRANDNNNEASNYFKNLENETNKSNNKNDYVKPIAIDYNPREDSWEDLPSANKFSVNTWKENDLDLKKANGKWMVTDSNGNICGRLEDPAVVVNFETESIEAIGEYDKIDYYCEEVKKEKKFREGSPSQLDKLGFVRFDSKNNGLDKVRDLFGYSWAFRD